jgi:hypothetical protein
MEVVGADEEDGMKLSELYSFDATAARIETVADDLMRANDDLRRAGRAWAESENDYRRAKATAFLNIEEGTIPVKTAKVDQVCDRERRAAHIAEADREACLERVRSLRAHLSALQTLANVTINEMRMADAPQPQWK